MPNYSWVTDPPVAEVSSEGFRGLLVHFENNVVGYGDSSGTGMNAGRLSSIREVVEAMRGCLDDSDGSNCFVYMIAGQPIGLMIMSGGMSLKIDEMVAHPGADGAGTIMLEFAVNRSQTLGKAGKLVLDSLNNASTSFWEAMGFKKFAELPAQQANGGCKMRLDPSNNPSWVPVGGKWRLKKYADQKLTKYSTATAN